MNKNVEQIIEKYIGLYKGMPDKVMVFSNPSQADLKELSIQKISELRMISDFKSGNLFIWNSSSSLHVKIYKELVKNNIIKDPVDIKISEYDYPDSGLLFYTAMLLNGKIKKVNCLSRINQEWIAPFEKYWVGAVTQGY